MTVSNKTQQIIDDNMFLDGCRFEEAFGILENKGALPSFQEPFIFFYNLWKKFPPLLRKILLHKQYIAALDVISEKKIALFKEMLEKNINNVYCLVELWENIIRQYLITQNEKSFGVILSISLGLLLAESHGEIRLVNAVNKVINNENLTMMEREILLLMIVVIIENPKEYNIKIVNKKIIEKNIAEFKDILNAIEVATEIKKFLLPEKMQALIYKEYKRDNNISLPDGSFTKDIWREIFLERYSNGPNAPLAEMKGDKSYQELLMEVNDINDQFTNFLVYQNEIDHLEAPEKLINSFLEQTYCLFTLYNIFIAGFLYGRLVTMEFHKSNKKKFILKDNWDDMAIDILESLQKNNYEEETCSELLTLLRKRFFSMQRARELENLLNHTHFKADERFTKVRKATQLVKILEGLYAAGDNAAGFRLAELAVTPLFESDDEKLSYPISFGDAEKILGELIPKDFRKEECKIILEKILKEEKLFENDQYFSDLEINTEIATPPIPSPEDSENEDNEQESSCGWYRNV